MTESQYEVIEEGFPRHRKPAEISKFFVRFYEHQGASRWDGRFKKRGKQSIGRSRGGWNTKVHLVAASDRNAVTFELSPGEAGDAPEGRKRLEACGKIRKPTHLLMDRANEGDNTRALALELGFIPVVPPKRNRLAPWQYDRDLCKLRNRVQRLFRRIKRFRRIFIRYDKLKVIFIAFLFLAFILDALLLLCIWGFIRHPAESEPISLPKLIE